MSSFGVRSPPWSSRENQSRRSMMASGGVREGEKSEQEGKREGRGRGRPSEEESLLDAGLEAELDISVGCPGEDKDPSNDLPLLIMVEFDGYKGSLFEDTSQDCSCLSSRG